MNKNMPDDIDQLSSKELNDLKRRVERRLQCLDGEGSRSVAEVLASRENVDLVAIAVKQTGIRCRTVDAGKAVTLRPGAGLRSEAEAHILTVRPLRAWTYGRTAYLSGQVLAMRLDVSALGLVPLKLEDEALWDPKEEYWGEAGEPIMKCFKPLIAAGARPSFEMEQILPGFDCDDPDSDPIGRAVDLHDAGEAEKSYRVLHQCLEEDLRVLDAHAHLGHWAFGDGSRRLLVEKAQRNYEAGVGIAELSLGSNFKGVLAWNRINNRPFLRCLHGLGLCRWTLGDLKGARDIFERMLWLNPSDNQGVRFCLAEVAAGTRYEDSKL
ncbi:MAG: hypothetical protein RQ748_05415 [Elusimicrobiales bacterium]|nr:hypothetical protein [Elusimicrobiales bacterium]